MMDAETDKLILWFYIFYLNEMGRIRFVLISYEYIQIQISICIALGPHLHFGFVIRKMILIQIFNTCCC